MSVTKKQLRDFVRRLGKTPQEVYRTVKRRGVEFKEAAEYDQFSCPIALALKQRWPTEKVVVIPYDINAEEIHGMITVNGVSVNHTEATKEFVEQYDEVQEAAFV